MKNKINKKNKRSKPKPRPCGCSGKKVCDKCATSIFDMIKRTVITSRDTKKR